MQFSFNPHIDAVEAPPIPTAQSWKAGYNGACGPMIDLSQAVPGDPPPASMLEALAKAAADPENAKYGAILGDIALREAYAASVSAHYGATVTVLNVAITAGCNQAFVITMMALAQAGDAIILPAPWYFNHKMTLDMLGLTTLVLPCRADNGFVPDLAEAEALLRHNNVKALVLVSPNNPTGAVYPPETLARFTALARSYKVALVLDETYRDFLPQGQSCAHNLFKDPTWGDTLIQLYSFSKAHALPGARLGAVVAAPAFIVALEKILDSLHICPARIAQGAVAWAIPALADLRATQRQELARRAIACEAAFAQLKGWKLNSIGAYFAFVAHPFKDESAASVAERLAKDKGVLTLPGSYFGPGLEGHLRVAFANVGVKQIEDAIARLS